MMEILTNFAGASAAPVHVADHRPTADAAALAGDPRPAAAAMSVLPAPVSQTAEVSRSLVAQSASVTALNQPEAVKGIERVLKPWGVAMLPALPESHGTREAPRQAKPQVQATPHEAGPEHGKTRNPLTDPESRQASSTRQSGPEGQDRA